MFPVSELTKMINKIRRGTFEPDMLHTLDDVASDIDTESSSEDEDDDPEGQRRRSCGIIASTLSDVRLKIPIADERRFLNLKTKTIHAGRSGSVRLTRCGIDLCNLKLLSSSALDGGDSKREKLCKRCLEHRLVGSPDPEEVRTSFEAVDSHQPELTPTEGSSDSDLEGMLNSM